MHRTVNSMSSAQLLNGAKFECGSSGSNSDLMVPTRPSTLRNRKDRHPDVNSVQSPHERREITSATYLRVKHRSPSRIRDSLRTGDRTSSVVGVRGGTGTFRRKSQTPETGREGREKVVETEGGSGGGGDPRPGMARARLYGCGGHRHLACSGGEV